MVSDIRLTFDLVDRRFRLLEMRLVARITDTLGRPWRYGSVYVEKPGVNFYASLEQANQHAGEIAWVRGLERDEVWQSQGGPVPSTAAALPARADSETAQRDER